jgi:nuclease-like protein
MARCPGRAQIAQALVEAGTFLYAEPVPSNVTFSWSQIIWSFLAVVLVVAALVTRRWLVNRRRKERNERPPQRTKLLRPAGDSCLCQVDEIFDKLLLAYIEAIAAGAICGLSFGPIASIIQALLLRRFSLAQLWAAPHSSWLLLPVLVSALALAWCIRTSRLVFRYEDEIRNWRLGARGEQAVAESLADPMLAAAGYRAFHDLPGDGQWNIDHVVVGPAGVFVIESKACARRKSKSAQAEHVVRYDGRVLHFPWRDDDEAVSQAEANARWVREKIAPYAPKDVPVQPVIVVPGWWVESSGDFSVKAMNAKYLVNHLASLERRFTPDQLQAINSRLDELCRTLEF